MKLTRRSFLLGAGAAGLSAVRPGSAAATEAQPGAEYATLLDIEKCIGCGACVEACRERNGQRYPKVRKPLPVLFPASSKNEDWSEKQDVDDRLTPYNWLFIESVTVRHGDATHTLNIPRRCMHCINPPCANLCPWGSCGRNPVTGTVVIDPDTCLGGAKCRTVCPWQVPQRQSGVGLYLDLMPRYAGNGVMYKCDRCADSFARGEVPACVEVCPEEVQTIGPRDVILAQALMLARARGHYLYGVNENGGTNTFYLSPVPFEVLAEAGGSGPGKPTLAAVPDSMATAENLTRMLWTAPVAGLAAGVVRAARSGAGTMPLPDAAARGADVTPKVTQSVTSDVTPGDTANTTAAAARPAPSGRASLVEAGFLKRFWVVLALLLGFTGMMQMPVAARYGITKIPGLAWTGDSFLTLYLHYVLAALLLGLGAYWLGVRLRRRGAFPRLTVWARVRLGVLAGLVGSGILGVCKNLAFISYDIGFIMAVDLVHLGLAGLLGVLSLALWVTGRGAWISRAE